MKWVGHRGCLFAVENTIEAYKEAINLGCEYLECDVRLSKDGIFFISHDDNFHRLSRSLSKTKLVEEYDSSEIKEINLTQTRRGVTYYGKVCFLKDYLTLCYQNNVHAIMDIKWTTGLNPNDASKYQELIALLKETKMYNHATLLMSVCLAELEVMPPRVNCIEYIRSFDKEIDISLLANTTYEKYYDFCFKNRVSMDVYYERLSKELIDEFHQHNLIVNTWTVNQKEDALKAISWGVDLITTDLLMKE